MFEVKVPIVREKNSWNIKDIEEAKCDVILTLTLADTIELSEF